MIKRLLLICLLLFVFISSRAQPYGNEWINYFQQYYKIKIAQNGVYRIDSAALASAGIPLSSIDPRNFQIFNNGSQQSIFVQGENDGAFNNGDFIEFYAEKNDGKLDSLLYVHSSFVPNPYYSLVNDTAVYFLTWNNLLSNKRMQSITDTAFSSFGPAADFFYKDEIHDFHGDYYSGETDIVNGTDARYTRSEGWFDANVIYLGLTYSYTNLINTSNRFLAGPNAIIKTVAVGASKDIGLLIPGLNDHHLKIEYGPSNNLLVDTAFKGYESNRFIYSVPVSNLGNTFTDFKFSSIADANFNSNRTVVSYIDVKYPHTFDLEGKNNFLMYLPDNSTNSKSYLNISNFNGIGTAYLYDLSNAKRFGVVQTGANYKVLVPNSGGEKKCFITSDGAVTNITSLKPVSPSGKFTNYSTPSNDSAFIIITNKLLMNSAVNYKNYRSANIYGGMHNVILADINELYDQFAFGIVKSPLSIRHFCEYIIDNNPAAPPKNLFLLGKSIHLNLCRQNAANYASCLVPSFGYPSSDNLLTSGINGGGIEPAIATGRLSAKNTNDVDLYLNKVQQYENKVTNPPAEWMKYILHFGGGNTAGEQTSFKSYLNNYKRIIQDTSFGGTVIKEFFKTSSAPIEINSSDTLRDLINNGVALMTFFGHASGTGFDQSIDDVNTYNPLPGHYPLLLGNSCFSGDFHQPDNTANGYPLSSSETFVLAANKGVIGYIGSVGLGVPYALNSFSTGFYNELSYTNYGKNVGSSIKKAIASISNLAINDTLERAVCYEMSLQGDPAIRISTSAKPDYKITNSDVYFDVLTKPDSFVVSAVRTNIGKATNDTIICELQRIFPNGDTTLYLVKDLSPKFKDTISFTIWNDDARGVGLNMIKITLDSKGNVDEMNENNNSTNPYIDVIINGSDIIPVYPYQFAIIPKDTVTLKASTTDPLAAAKNYIFQIDTTDAFTSPLASTLINSIGGVIKWHPPITFSNNAVYYWRVSPDSTNPLSGYHWRESSFQYIAGKRGWEQAHFFQFKNDGYQFVKYNRPQRKFNFSNDLKNIFCQDGIVPYIGWTDVIYSINGSVKNVWSYTVPGISIAVFDPISGNPIANHPQGTGYGDFGSIDGHDLGVLDYFFDFRQGDSASRSVLKDFINLHVPNGYYVLAYSQYYHSIPSYENSVYNAFEALGSSQIRSVPASVPYILFGRKGNAIGQSKEIIGSSVSSIIQLDTALTTNWNEGYIASPIIGPAYSWDSLSWKQHSIDGVSTKDSIVVRLIGIRPNGTDTALANFDAGMLDIANLSSYVNASAYPKIRLVAYMKDDSLHTPPQLDRWQVIYTPVPEAAINPIAGYSFPNDTLQEGASLNLKLPIQNISDYPFTQDSLLVTYWVEDANRVNHFLPSKLKKKPFNPSEIIIDTISLSTIDYHGANALWVEVNPIGQVHSQLEQYHFNNIIRIPFYTNVDRVNPLLDVTFDGVHILNNDIVSAKPNVLIKLKDENQFLALNDTNDFKVFIKAPSSSLAQRVFFGSNMTFIPAVLPNNSCKINYTPTLLQDGTYQLLVQAKDKSDNQSGDVDYKISFEVVNKSTITEVMNYPNPFTTSTRFVFTLTGASVPSDFKIQIMTITGKVVREIFQDEIGPLHVGRNITEYAWDGRDEFGDRLANGVYLYRVITRINGEDIEKRNTEADQYFKKGWGKMYLMR